jgi:glyoxylase-like metal-dependent hydrolase (beta-lactamase superfamily II)
MTARTDASVMLNHEVFVAKRAGLTRDVPAGTESLQWVTNTATLIYGTQDAVLVDTLLTQEQNLQLSEWIAKSGKHLSAIYITHAHGDHAFGITMVLDRFPQARAVATPAVAQAMQAQIGSDSLRDFYLKLFPGQIPDPLGLPEALDRQELDLEGQNLVVIEDGFTDTADSTSLYVPSLGLLVAGDAVYNGVHPYLAETTEQTRLNWIAALDRLEALNPRVVVAGHKNPANGDEPRHIAATRTYLRDFNRLTHETTTRRELYDKMLALHAERANPGSLWGAAKAAKGE